MHLPNVDQIFTSVGGFCLLKTRVDKVGSHIMWIFGTVC